MTESMDLLALTLQAREQHAQFERASNDALHFARAAGESLHDIRRALPHGKFHGWIHGNMLFAVVTACNYMRLATNWARVENLLAETPGLTLRAVLKKLSSHRATSEGRDQLSFHPPVAGQLVIGLLRDDYDCAVVQSMPRQPGFSQVGVRQGNVITLLDRCVEHDGLDSALRSMGVEPSTVDWCQPIPATQAKNPLSPHPGWKFEELPKLRREEAVVEKHLANLGAVMESLQRVRDYRLHARTHGTFEGYARDRFGLDPEDLERMRQLAEDRQIA
ncbi:protein-tyrosine phosphatase family protein [Schlesneria paludicola]|uniref:hypothetical protein n=1 Tax=Schlesneria paludicola TaxID=360056 RepID=UPI00029A87A5|nr:hypothetical protein [Schlesneria paludicola]